LMRALLGAAIHLPQLAEEGRRRTARSELLRQDLRADRMLPSATKNS
jgi:hypothetical protein